METKSSIQAKAGQAWEDAGQRGLLAMATGSGKSKIAIDKSYELLKQNINAVIVLVVPTENLRDNNWRDEFFKWNRSNIWKYRIHRFCYASVNKIKGQTIDLLILDEVHNTTLRNSALLRDNTIHRILALSATPPNSKSEQGREKLLLLQKYKIPTVFTYTLDEAVRDGLVAPYIINVVEIDLDDKTAYVKSGTKKRPFMTTEKKHYDILTRRVQKAIVSGSSGFKWLLLNRMRFIYGLRTKQEVARRILAKYVSPEERYIIFSGSVSQAESLLPGKAFHYKSKKKGILEKFKEGKINQIAVINILNEGENIEGIDGAVIVQVNSNDRDLIQRIGRTIRIRPGHTATIWLLVSKGTVDEEWAKSALAELDKKRIRYFPYKKVI